MSANVSRRIFSCVRRDPISYPHITEPSIIIEGNTAHLWTRFSTGYDIYYATSQDPRLREWVVGNGGNPILSYPFGVFPYVYPQRVGDFYYMLLQDLYGNLYLLSSEDKINWDVCNGGYPNQVLTPTSGDFAWIGNPTLAIVDGVWHLLIDGNHVGPPQYWVQGYSYAVPEGVGPDTIINFQPNFKTSPVIVNGGCAGLIHVPSRNSLLAVTAEVDFRGVNTHTKIVAYAADLSKDLSLSSSWNKSNFNLIGNTATSEYGPADPFLVVNDDNDNFYKGTILGVNWEQWDMILAYSRMNITEFYDYIFKTQCSVTI